MPNGGGPACPLHPRAQVLQLQGNPHLTGSWPDGLALPHLVALDVRDTALTACSSQASPPPAAKRRPTSSMVDEPCALAEAFNFAAARTDRLPGQQGMLCPTVQLRSYDSLAAQHPELAATSGLGLLLAPSELPLGAVVSAPAFFRFHDCLCVHPRDTLTLVSPGGAAAGQLLPQWECGDAWPQMLRRLVQWKQTATIGLVLAAVVPWLLLVAGVYLIRRWACAFWGRGVGNIRVCMAGCRPFSWGVRAAGSACRPQLSGRWCSC